MSSIEFASLRSSVDNGLREIVLYIQILFFIHGAFISLVIMLALLFSQFYFIPLLYVLWFIYDRNKGNEGGRRMEWFRRTNFWKYVFKYFPLKMIKTAEIDPTKNYFFCSHPHGITCSGATGCFGSEATNFSQAYPGIIPRLLVLENILWTPLFRELSLAAGFCASTPAGIEWLLTKEGTGNALVLIVGGAAESLEANPGTATLVLKKRKGFIKLALKHGVSLVPVFSFGENEIYKQVKNPEGSLLRKFQNKFQKIFRIATPLYYGRGFSSLPFRKEITIVIGKPIHLEKIPEPTKEDIDATHQMYINRLTELFEEHKVKYAPNLCLKII